MTCFDKAQQAYQKQYRVASVAVVGKAAISSKSGAKALYVGKWHSGMAKGLQR